MRGVELGTGSGGGTRLKLSRTSVGRHPSPEDLMCLLDGELAPKQAADVELHLSSCSECREALAQFSSAAVCFSSTSLFPELEEMGSDLTARIPISVPCISSTSAPRVRINTSIAAGIAVLLAVALLQYLVFSPPPVSARGLVGSARAEQGEVLRQHPSKSIRRRLKVTKSSEQRGGRNMEPQNLAVAAPEFWDTSIETNASQEVLETDSATAGEIASVLPRAACRELVPLSIDMLECLLDSRELTSVVRVSGSGRFLSTYEIEIASSAQRPGLHFASSWRLRASDWHLTDVTYRVGRSTGIDVFHIEEHNYSLMPGGHIESSSELPARKESTPELTIVVASPESTSSAASAAVSKLRAFELLNAFGITPEDDLSVVLDPSSGRVRIEGMVPDVERQARIRSLVSAVDGVDVEVSTYAEAVDRIAPLSQSTADDASGPSRSSQTLAPRAPVRSDGPLLSDLLDARFGSDESGRALSSGFGATILAEAQQLLFEARWMERLGEAVPPDVLRNLSHTDQQRFAALQTDALVRLLTRHRQLHQLVSSVLCPDRCQYSANPDAGEQAGALIPVQNTGVPWIPSLNRELSLLKTMFVDREFEKSVNAVDVVALWHQTSQKVEDAMEPGIVRRPSDEVRTANVDLTKDR